MSGDTTPEGGPLRHLMGTVDGGAPYRPLATLADARATADGIVVLEGDEGGQIYVVVPARHVHCDERAVRALLPRRREGRPPRPHRRGPRRGLTLCVAWIPYVGCRDLKADRAAREGRLRREHRKVGDRRT